MSNASDVALELAKTFADNAKFKLDEEDIGQLAGAIEMAMLRYNEDYWQREWEESD